MKQEGMILVCLLGLLTPVMAGTYTKLATRIPVPASADGTPTGDTAATTTNVLYLDANVYLPEGVVAPAPVIVLVHGFAETKSTALIVTIAEDFAAAGYVVVTPTIRGFGHSNGQVSLVGPDEINDLKTIILAMQTGAIGSGPAISLPVTSASKFGVMGPSYGGGHSFEIMRTHVAGLTAVMPIIGWTDLYQALAPNDVPKLTYTLGLFAGGFDIEKPNYATVMFDWLRDILNGTPEKLHLGDMEESIDWRSVIFNPSELTVPVFAVQGWRDDLFPAEQSLNLGATSNSIPFLKLYIGGIGHPPASLSVTGHEGEYLRAQAVRWFDCWLKGIDNGITNEPPITLAPEFSANWSTNVLIQTSEFPLAGTTNTTYFINGSDLTSNSAAVAALPIPLRATSGFLSSLHPLLHRLGISDNNSLLESVLSVASILNSGSTDILNSQSFTKVDGSSRKLKFVSAILPAIHIEGFVNITEPDTHSPTPRVDLRQRLDMINSQSEP